MWALIIVIHVGTIGGNSNAITNISGFKTKEKCEVASLDAGKLITGKDVRTKCVQVD